MTLKEKQHDYYITHKAVALARRKAYYADHREAALAYSRAYAQQHPDRINAVNKRWRDKNAAKVKEYSREKQRVRRLAARGEVPTAACPICQVVSRLVWDHCHERNKFRGRICMKCNFMLGYAKDSPSILRTGAKYLEDFNYTEDIK